MSCRITAPRPSILAALAVASLAAALGAEPPQASGTFSGRDWEFQAVGAYAFPGEVGVEREPGIRLAVSNAVFNAETIDRFWDREYVIANRFADEETLVVTFQFAPDGAYRGMTYSFGEGDGCGFCYDGKAVSTVRVAGGRLVGELTLAPQPGESSWQLAFDVPVAPAEYGEPLPAGGGEVGTAYAAYHAALVTGDQGALAGLFQREIAARLAEHGEKVVAAWREDHPTQNYRVVRGFRRGDRALLLIEGETPYFGVDVEAHLVREDGAWKLDDEMMQVRFDDD